MSCVSRRNIWNSKSISCHFDTFNSSYKSSTAEEYTERMLSAQLRQLDPLKEDLAEWLNNILGICNLNGDNLLNELDNGVILCHLAQMIHERALKMGKVPAPKVQRKYFEKAMRRSFFSRDNMENFINFCRSLGVHQNLLFESDDLVLHNQPRNVIVCLLEVARLINNKYNIEPPGLVQLEKEIAAEEEEEKITCENRLSWQFRENDTNPQLENSSTLDWLKESKNSVPSSELDKRVDQATKLMNCHCENGGKCARLHVRKIGEGKYNIAGRNVLLRLLKGRHVMVRVGGGWDTLDHFLLRHDPCQECKAAKREKEVNLFNRGRKYTYYWTFKRETFRLKETSL